MLSEKEIKKIKTIRLKKYLGKFWVKPLSLTDSKREKEILDIFKKKNFTYYIKAFSRQEIPQIIQSFLIFFSDNLSSYKDYNISDLEEMYFQKNGLNEEFLSYDLVIIYALNTEVGYKAENNLARLRQLVSIREINQMVSLIVTIKDISSFLSSDNIEIMASSVKNNKSSSVNLNKF